MRILMLILIFGISAFSVSAQHDKIIYLDGHIEKGKITEISESIVVMTNLSKIIRRVDTGLIEKIVFKNGIEQVFTQKLPTGKKETNGSSTKSKITKSEKLRYKSKSGSFSETIIIYEKISPTNRTNSNEVKENQLKSKTKSI